MSVEMDSNTEIKTIYVKLLDEGVDVIRPVSALRLDLDRYRILQRDDYLTLDEKWEFEPGSEVFCRHELRDEENILVASKLAN